MAATFFGEVLPVISRAVDEDDDDEEVERLISTSVVRWSPKARAEIEASPENTVHCKVLLIADGPAATGFTEAFLLEPDSERLGVLCSGLVDQDINSLGQTAHTDKTCYIHRLKSSPEVLLVLCNTVVSAEQSYSWVQQLLPSVHLQDTYVGVLATSSTSEYRSEVSPGDLPTPFLRALKTERFHGTPVCPYLEPPNTATGLAAQILSYCQVHDRMAVLYTCYTDATRLDFSTMKAFQKILKYTPIKDYVLKDNSGADKMLLKLVELHEQHSTLYI